MRGQPPRHAPTRRAPAAAPLRRELASRPAAEKGGERGRGREGGGERSARTSHVLKRARLSTGPPQGKKKKKGHNVDEICTAGGRTREWKKQSYGRWIDLLDINTFSTYSNSREQSSRPKLLHIARPPSSHCGTTFSVASSSIGARKNLILMTSARRTQRVDLHKKARVTTGVYRTCLHRPCVRSAQEEEPAC